MRKSNQSGSLPVKCLEGLWLESLSPCPALNCEGRLLIGTILILECSICAKGFIANYKCPWRWHMAQVPICISQCVFMETIIIAIALPRHFGWKINEDDWHIMIHIVLTMVWKGEKKCYYASGGNQKGGKMRRSLDGVNRSKIAGKFELTYLPTISGS